MANDHHTTIFEIVYAELDEHGYEDDDEKRAQVARHFADTIVQALPTAVEDADYWMGQFVRLMRVLDLETDPWHSDDVIDMAADFAPLPPLGASNGK